MTYSTIIRMLRVNLDPAQQREGTISAIKLIPSVPFMIYLVGCIPKAGESLTPSGQVLNTLGLLTLFLLPLALTNRKRKK